MPSPEEFAPRPGQSVMTPQKMNELRERARAIRQAQAAGTPIPGTEYATTAPPAAPAPAQFAPEYRQPFIEAGQPATLNEPQTELELVRMRFKLASYYEVLIAEPIFGDDVYTDPYAAQVHAEVTQWASNRMAELAGVRNNPEGFVDEEVQLLKSLARSLGPDGVKALVFLADRVLNPPAVLPAPQPPPAPPAPPVVEEPEDDAPSAMTLGVTPTTTPVQAAPPVQPAVVPAKPRKPAVRRARVPGAPAVTVQSGSDVAPQSPPAPQKRTRKRQDDPLAAGRALVASQGAEAPPSAPAAAPARAAGAPAAPAADVQPVPMPKGLGMSMAMEQKAGEALRSANVIEATGGGVL